MGELPSIHTFLHALQKCKKSKNLASAKLLHAHICNHGLESHLVVGNYLVPMFVACGSLSDAQQVFSRLFHRNVHSWSSLILGYVECGQPQYAFELYQKMRADGIQPCAYTLGALLKACVTLKDVETGREIHLEITERGFDRDFFVGSTLVDMYAKCGSLLEAEEVFCRLPDQDVVCWNALIAGYAEHGPGQALKVFQQMQLKGVSPSAVTFICVLKACASMGDIDRGRDIHSDLAQKGFEEQVFVCSTLVDMYAKCGSLSEAREVFDKLPVQNVVSWNAVIAGYAEHGSGQEALNCFKQMQLEGINADAVTFVGVLKACGSIGAIDKGREIHAAIQHMGFERDIFLGNTLVDMYAKTGSLSEAQEIFNGLPVRTVVSWSALIAGYAEHGPGQEALKCFEEMQLEGVSPNVVTFICALKACANIGAINKGREIHADIAQNGFERHLFVGNTLVDMYAKCGSLAKAREVFDNLPVRDVVSWSAMIQGYGMNHEGNMAVQCFEDMLEHGVEPVDVTFTCLLSACSRVQLVVKGQEFFNLMKEEFGIAPAINHHSCVVDLLSQSGHLYEAESFLEKMPCPPSWRTLLSACKTYGKAELGQRCFQQLVLMNPECAASYVLMANTYACAGRWDEACKIEELRKHAGAKKKPATALIEVHRNMHEFVVGSNQSKDILGMLEILSSRMKEEGYVPNII